MIRSKRFHPIYGVEPACTTAPGPAPPNTWPWLPFRIMRRVLPHWPICNVALMGYAYRLRHGRWPRRLTTPSATINDYIFNRLTRRRWSVFEQACSDKTTAKLIAGGLAPGVFTADTVAVFPLTGASTTAEVLDWLAPYLGRRLVLKPSVVLDFSWKHLPRPAVPVVPANFAALVKAATQLCHPFDFVRVDLYNTASGIFSGEFTLTPSAGMQILSDEDFGIDLLHRVRDAQRAAVVTPCGG